METQKKFQNKRLNKDDHIKTDKAAKNLKRGFAVAGTAAGIGLTIKKFGLKKTLEVAKTVVKTVAQAIVRK